MNRLISRPRLVEGKSLPDFPCFFYHEILLVAGFSPGIPSPLEKYEFVSWDDDSQDIEK